GVLDAGQQSLEIGQGELEPRTARRLFLFPRKEVDFDHAARLSARPTDSIKSGATSSTETDSNTESRTLSRCTGLASSTGTRSRFDSASFRPGTRAPPPIVYPPPPPPADRVHPPPPPRGARRRREERRRPLHPHRDLLAPRVHVLRQVPALGL